MSELLNSISTTSLEKHADLTEDIKNAFSGEGSQVLRAIPGAIIGGAMGGSRGAIGGAILSYLLLSMLLGKDGVKKILSNNGNIDYYQRDPHTAPITDVNAVSYVGSSHTEPTTPVSRIGNGPGAGYGKTPAKPLPTQPPKPVVQPPKPVVQPQKVNKARIPMAGMFPHYTGDTWKMNPDGTWTPPSTPSTPRYSFNLKTPESRLGIPDVREFREGKAQDAQRLKQEQDNLKIVDARDKALRKNRRDYYIAEQARKSMEDFDRANNKYNWTSDTDDTPEVNTAGVPTYVFNPATATSEESDANSYNDLSNLMQRIQNTKYIKDEALKDGWTQDINGTWNNFWKGPDLTGNAYSTRLFGGY